MSKRKENSTNSLNQKALNEYCGMVYAHGLISGRWKMLMLYKLEHGPMRYSELKKKLPNITERMLTLQLKDLENNHLIIRRVYPEVPTRVEYELTDSAKILSPVWRAMEQWGDDHRARYAKL